ncbi:hypothetical protein R4P64_33480 [Rhodococcus sp. IEGM 1366]|uniref:hypothetical protein n=1 Tax=Rhodococcus sp. IEGM 1366 TaxID=3082223 RepID=UPI002953771E|nr:hypothetical protein [Rhodococcus sp. IEGM 1366]MDV8071426.1 hypothetical protein [Rhodococcus sp. IEGM 1366]
MSSRRAASAAATGSASGDVLIGNRTSVVSAVAILASVMIRRRQLTGLLRDRVRSNTYGDAAR